MELKGILQKFDNKHNGRIYPQSAFDKVFIDLQSRLRAKTRKDKIKKIYEN
jgi:ribosomal protein L20A (L18A)